MFIELGYIYLRPTDAIAADVSVLVTLCAPGHSAEADREGSCWDWEAGVLSVHLLWRMGNSLMLPPPWYMF